MKESPLPLEFNLLSGKVHYVRERVRGKEWSSNCPNCGGEPHPNGELPDRFRMWTVSKIGKPFGWCRVCNYKWFNDKDVKPDPEKIEKWRKERIEYETRIKEEAELAIKNLTDIHKWEEYYSWLMSDGVANAYWKGAGIHDEYWWGEWKLGFDPMHSFWFDSDNGWIEHKTPTATIPVRDITGRIINIKHRLLNPFQGIKYRMEYKTHTEPIFISNLDLKNPEFVIKCEGEKKSAVTWLALDSMKVQVYGLPKSPSDEMLESIKAKVIIDILDPDVKVSERVKNIYKDVDYRVLRLPSKIDDMILYANLEKQDVRAMLKQARKV